ncbi:MAG TPA: hypothetical protein VMV61_10190 [Patescibacteria group bacterium]|nr:hypothetical protein [Patescibacteria group bacterium]
MNKSFLIIFIPAVLVAAMYLFLGIYPPVRVLAGVAMVAAGLAAWGIRTWMKRSGTVPASTAAAPSPTTPTPPAAPASPTASQS